MADDLYQTMLQEQAKEEAAAGLTPIPNQAKAPDSSTQGWTNNGNIQYNDSGDTALSQQASLRQFWDETKNRFSATRILLSAQSDNDNFISANAGKIVDTQPNTVLKIKDTSRIVRLLWMEGYNRFPNGSQYNIKKPI
jgi:hypothetical protein